MPSNQQRREAERLRLQRQLEQRREREVSRRRVTLIVSIVATLVLIAGVITVIAVFAGGSQTPAAGSPNPTTVHGRSSSPASPTVQPSPTSPLSSSAPALAAPKACAKPGKGATATFAGLKIANATTLKKAPSVSGKSNTSPKALECRDLVVGKGKAATASSTVTVQYTGVLYKDGKVFDSSWSHGTPASFPLNHVIPGFNQGIGGTGKVAPMRVGGRRVIVLPPALGYGSQGAGSTIPPNSTQVFVVDLLKVSG